MSSGSRRFPVDIDDLLESSGHGTASITAGLNKKKALSREAKITCDACGKESDEKKPLQACVRCRTVRYCNKACQVAHFNRTHKADCKSFAQPPLCRAFDTKTILPGCVYPETPIFARDHVDGMGCWVSIGGSIDCRLSPILGNPTHDGRRLTDNMSFEEMMGSLPGQSGNFLSIRVLVQNRISAKNAAPRIVVGKLILAVTSARGTPGILEGTLPGEGYLKLEDPNGDPIAALAPMYFALTHFNGKTVQCNDHPAVKDKLTCAVVLEMGDFAIFEVQYRCGGPRVKRDFEALELLQYINVPSTAYDPNFRGPFTEVIPQAAERDDVCEVHAMIDYAALAAWYGDFKTKGEQAYLRSHYGEARARMSQSGNRALEQHFGMLMNMMRSGEFGNPGDR
ncbi:hypothetical protein Hypma_001692 [Hypsizygus marmoreus]|uniref:MYND-type domain-containing protein n=1 Tax=Hypsizygus marmoreus TaxID=39966 RepID=A0A369JCM6_HYPMA|nr:hypothetical protein Hypma_001692 [Hypsizygus marmoreus]